MLGGNGKEMNQSNAAGAYAKMFSSPFSFFFTVFFLSHSLTDSDVRKRRYAPQKIRMTWVEMGPDLETEPEKGIT